MSSTQVEIEMGIWLEDVLSKPLNTKVLSQIMIESLKFAKYYGWNHDLSYCSAVDVGFWLIYLNTMCYHILEDVKCKQGGRDVMETIADVKDVLETINEKYMNEVPQLA